MHNKLRNGGLAEIKSIKLIYEEKCFPSVRALHKAGARARVTEACAGVATDDTPQKRGVRVGTVEKFHSHPQVPKNIDLISLHIRTHTLSASSNPTLKGQQFWSTS